MNITRGKIPSAQKIMIYGPEGIGKSTMAALFPDPVFLDVEGSTKHMDVSRLPVPTSWTMLMQAVAFVASDPTCCKTLVIDTADWAEQLCIAHVCAKAQVLGIEDFGYGKGYTYLAEEFGNLLNRLTDVVDAGVHVVLTGHATIRKFEQPDEQSAYDRWELKLQKKTAPLVKEWSDMVLFVNYKTIVVKSEGTKTPKGAGGRERVVYTTHTAAWDAKNRHDLPDEFALGKGTALPKALADAIAFMAPMQAPQDTSTPVEDQAPAEVVPEAAPAVEAELTEAFGEPVEVANKPDQDSVPHRLKPLYDLMSASGVSVSDLQRAVAHKGYFPAATPVENYPQDFVDGALIAAWPKVLTIIAELKNIPF